MCALCVLRVASALCALSVSVILKVVAHVELEPLRALPGQVSGLRSRIPLVPRALRISLVLGRFLLLRLSGALDRARAAVSAAFLSVLGALRILGVLRALQIVRALSSRRPPSQERREHLAVDIRLAVRGVARGRFGLLVFAISVVHSRELRNAASLLIGLCRALVSGLLNVCCHTRVRVFSIRLLLCVERRAEARLASSVLCGALCALQLLFVHLALQVEDLVAERGDSLLCLNLCLLRLLRLELLDVLDGLFPGLLLRA